MISTNKTKETIASDDSSGNVKKLDQKKGCSQNHNQNNSLKKTENA